MSNYAEVLRREDTSAAQGINVPKKAKSDDAQVQQSSQIRLEAPVRSAHERHQSVADRTSTSRGPSFVARKSPKNMTAGPPLKKARKPKPTLKNMSIGDMIGRNVKFPVSQRHGHPPSDTQILKKSEPSAPQRSFQKGDFPALSASAPAVGSTLKHSRPSLPVDTTSGSQRGGKPAVSTKRKAVPATFKKIEKRKRATVATMKGLPLPKVKEERRAASVMDSFVAKQRLDDGREHSLLKLMQEGKITTQKGRQRVTPRMKKFTTLKKKVLQERLRRWKEANPEKRNLKPPSSLASRQIDENPIPKSSSLCLRGFVGREELEDDEEMQEIIANLQEMAGKVGTARDVFVRPPSGISDDCPVFVLFSNQEEAAAAQSCWEGLVIGGQRLTAEILHPELVSEATGGSPNNLWRQSILNYSFRRDQATDRNGPVKLMLGNILSEDDLNDDDCLDETLSDVRSMLEIHGSLTGVVTDKHSGSVIATFVNASDARQAEAQMNFAVIGGNVVSAKVIHEEAMIAPCYTTASAACNTVSIRNALTEDDFKDEDNLEESLRDIRAVAETLGAVAEVDVKREENAVLVSYSGPLSVATNAAEQLNKTYLGGQLIVASVTTRCDATLGTKAASWVIVRNLLADDDLEDPDSLEETKRDIAELAGQYGAVVSVSLEDDISNHAVKIQYEGGIEIAMEAADKFSQMVIGGQEISAVALAEPTTQRISADRMNPIPSTNDESAHSEKKLLYSGDKLISERFAECKQVPKISSSDGSRHYAKVIDDGVVKPLLVEMLGELMRLQKRAIEDKNAKARRRLVMGLREVSRGIRSNKVKMVVMANNLDDYGVIDDKLQEILDLAKSQAIPVLFELNKRRLGKAVGKTIKIGVIGVQNAEGAHQQFKKLTVMAPNNPT